jgi:hypothetical protein
MQSIHFAIRQKEKIKEILERSSLQEIGWAEQMEGELRMMTLPNKK